MNKIFFFFKVVHLSRFYHLLEQTLICKDYIRPICLFIYLFSQPHEHRHWLMLVMSNYQKPAYQFIGSHVMRHEYLKTNWYTFGWISGF